MEGICIEGLRDYQFRQINQDTFEMLAEITDKSLEETICNGILMQMQQILAEKRLGYVRFVDEILPDMQTGKKRLILS